MLAVRLNPSDRITGVVMGFGAGALIGSIAYELVPESLVNDAGWRILAAFAAGALTFFVGDWLIDRRGGKHRKRIAQGRTARRWIGHGDLPGHAARRHPRVARPGHRPRPGRFGQRRASWRQCSSRTSRRASPARAA